MPMENIENDVDTPEAEVKAKPIVAQIGSKLGQERDATGQLKQAGEVFGVAEQDQNGNVEGTLRGPKLMRWVTDMVAREQLDTEGGGRELVLDLSRAQNVVEEEGLSEMDLSDGEVEALIDLRDTLKRTKNITLTLTGLKPDTVIRLRGAGMQQKGTRMVTKQNTAEALSDMAA